MGEKMVLPNILSCFLSAPGRKDFAVSLYVKTTCVRITAGALESVLAFLCETGVKERHWSAQLGPCSSSSCWGLAHPWPSCHGRENCYLYWVKILLLEESHKQNLIHLCFSSPVYQLFCNLVI